MKNQFNRIRGFFAGTAVRIQSAAIGTQSVLAGNRAEGFVDTAVKILISIVIGALILAGLYLLFSGTILPTLTQRIQEMFNFKG